MVNKVEGIMKLNLPGVTTAARCLFANWFSAVFLAIFLTIITASAAVPHSGLNEMTPVENWVVAQAMAGEIADLSKRFPAEKDRKLSAHFLGEFVMGTLQGFKPYRNRVRVTGAIIDEPIDLGNAQHPVRSSPAEL